MDILSVVTRVPILVFGFERHDDDFADRINYKYTVAVLVIFAIIVTNRQFGTKQIHCWIPAYFTRNYEEYINDICWVSNTYYISLDQKLPEAEQIRKSFELKYYQWVPFILLSQAFFFYIPHIAWRALSRRSGIDVRDIVEAASNYKSVDKYENRQKYMTYMLTAVDQYVDDPRRRKETRRSLFIKRLLSGICCISGKFLGNYLMVLYLFIKLAFIANCICQLFVLNLLLGHEFHKFGFELLDKIINGKGWDTGSRIFPKISMCDFRIREIGNPKVSHRYTVQCVLPINLFNQQIFTFIWFWYGIVLIVNVYSLCVWTYRFLPSKRLRYISRRIEIMRQALLWGQKNDLNFELIPDLHFHDFEKELIRNFVHDYLESDGLFILRVLSSNTSDFVCTELIQELWKYYRKQRKFNRTSDDDEDLNDDESLEFKKSLDDFEPPQPNRIRKNQQQQQQPPQPTKPRPAKPKRKLAESVSGAIAYDEPGGGGGGGGEAEGGEGGSDVNESVEETSGVEFARRSLNKRRLTGYQMNTAPSTNSRLKKNDLEVLHTSGGRSNKTNGNNRNLSKPLAVISEQIASIYNKSKKPVPETVTVAIASQQIPRPKINRTLSIDPKVLAATNGQEKRLKRPNNFARKLDTYSNTTSPVTERPMVKQMSLKTPPQSPPRGPPPPLPFTQPPPQSQKQQQQQQHTTSEPLSQNDEITRDEVDDPQQTSTDQVVHQDEREHEDDQGGTGDDQEEEHDQEADEEDKDDSINTNTSSENQSKLNSGKKSKTKYFETET